MRKPKPEQLWLAAALLCFFAAMVNSDQTAVFVTVGVVFLIVALDSGKEKPAK